MGDSRPLSAGDDDPQDEQHELIRETGNGPSVDNEESLLAEMFGHAEGGVYGPAPSYDESGEGY